MSKGKNIAIGISGVLVGGMLLTGGMAFADSSGTSTVANLANKIPWVGQMMGHRGGMPDGRGEMMGIKGQFGAKAKLSQENLDKLVKEGTMTQAKADSIKTKLNELAQAQSQQQISDALKVLVDKGTNTQAQADKILKSFDGLEIDDHGRYVYVNGTRIEMSPKEYELLLYDYTPKSWLKL